MFKVERKIFHIMNQDMYNRSSESTKECINTHYQTRDTVFSIIVSVAFILIITFLSYFDNGTESDFSQIIKVINWREIAPLFILSLTIGLINYIVRLIKKSCCKTTTLCTVVANVLQIIFAYIITKQLNFWNFDYMNSTSPNVNPNIHTFYCSLFKISTVVENILLCVIIGINIAEIITAFFKQYSNKQH